MYHIVLKTMIVVVTIITSNAFAWGQSVPNGEMFDAEIAATGITYTREACAELERQNTAVWVEVESTPYCLRYYAAGLKADKNSVVALWLHGDIMGKHELPANKRLKGLGVDDLIRQEGALSKRFGVPFIFLGRPGSYASAGRHFTMRERRIEADIVGAGVEALKAKYGIEKWSFGGHSGGGLLVADMLNHRRDIACAVISSAPGDFRDYLAIHNNPMFESPLILNPIASVATIPEDTNRRIFILADPRDENVKFVLHQPYLDALASNEIPAHFLPLKKALGPSFHNMVDIAETAVGLCAEGIPDNEIVRMLEAMPTQARRKTN